eukprot:14778865-Alexandrium_andersonii.AAC.1
MGTLTARPTALLPEALVLNCDVQARTPARVLFEAASALLPALGNARARGLGNEAVGLWHADATELPHGVVADVVEQAGTKLFF